MADANPTPFCATAPLDDEAARGRVMLAQHQLDETREGVGLLLAMTASKADLDGPQLHWALDHIAQELAAVAAQLEDVRRGLSGTAS